MSPRRACPQIRALYYLARVDPRYAARRRAKARALLTEIGGVGVYLDWVAATPPLPWGCPGSRGFR